MKRPRNMIDRPDGSDPLAEIINLLQPRAVFSKGISGAGKWAVRYSAFGQPGFCVVVEGRCRLSVDGEAPVEILAGDFVLLPATPAFTMSSLEPAPPRHIDPMAIAGGSQEVRHGRQDGPPEVRLLGGHFSFGSPNAALAVSLLPAMIHIRGNRDTRPHLIGGHGDYVWATGKFRNPPERDLETWFIPGGCAGAALYTFLQPGIYAYVNHNLIEAFELGAAGHFKVEGEWNNDLMRQIIAPAAI